MLGLFLAVEIAFVTLLRLSCAFPTSYVARDSLANITSLTTYSTDIDYLPQPGAFTVTLIKSSATQSSYKVVDSVSNKADGKAIPTTNQQATCTISSKDTQPAHAVNCSSETWQIYYLNYGANVAVIQHYVEYKQGRIQNNAGGGFKTTAGPAYRERRAIGIPAFTTDLTQANGGRYFGVEDDSVSEDGHSFDYIDGIGPAVTDNPL